MTKTQKKLKARVRARMAQTGESYVVAKRHILSKQSQPTSRELALIEALASREADIMERIRDHRAVGPKDVDELGELGFAVHQAMVARGVTPKHKKHLVKNRGVPIGTREFYTHVHSAQSLLRFIADPTANDDPADTTLGCASLLQVGQPRLLASIGLTRVANGWVASDEDHELHTERDGSVRHRLHSGVMALLVDAGLNPSRDLPEYLEWLWREGADRGLSPQAMDEAFAELSDWLTRGERLAPRSGVFRGISDDALRDLQNEPRADSYDALFTKRLSLIVYTNRWEHDDTIHVRLTPKGWTFEYVSEAIATLPDGTQGGEHEYSTGLEHLLDHEFVNYPATLQRYVSWLWHSALVRPLAPETVQEGLRALGEWISSCERLHPRGLFSQAR